jgi:hypothetical protein
MVDKKGIIQFIQPFYILFHVALSFIGWKQPSCTNQGAIQIIKNIEK